jgi:phosphoglycerate kinase
MNLYSKLHEKTYHNLRVFLRADLNVPCTNTNPINIIDDFRLVQLLPTIDLLIAQQCTIILATHRERPNGYEPALSTRVLASWFTARGYTIIYEPDLNRAQKTIDQHPGCIILLENLRFYKGEQSSDTQERMIFAHQLASLADYYVNDAFGALHRTDTSLIELPYLFKSSKRTIGLLIEEELKAINTLINQPRHPFILIVGGGKVSEKIAVALLLFESIDIFAPLPALSSTFMVAQNQPVGSSLVAHDSLKAIKLFITYSNQQHKKYIMPVDYMVAHKTLQGPLSIIDATAFNHTDVSVTIGPRSIKNLQEICLRAGTIVMNGLPGILNRIETIEPLKPLFETIAHSSAYTMVGGGQSIAAARLFNVNHSINHCSTGGGALLACLGKKSLTSLEPYQAF